ncbi:E3 UFM1-protein ligase 1 homolog, partial [Actinia tenebrosa]
ETSDFFNQFEVVSGPDLCEFMIKKLDKKKEKQLAIEHRAALQEQLRQEDEPAMALHLVTVLLFQHFTSVPIHAPGRCVPQIISFLASHLTPEQQETLTRYQSLVVKRLTGGPVTDESEPGEEEACEKSAGALLEEKLQEIKNMALNIKKSNNKEEK